MKANVLINNFNTGEVSKLIESRSDLSKFAAACKTLENAIPLVEGGAKKMPGTIFAGIAAKGGPLGTPTTGKSRMVPFSFSTSQTAMLEFYSMGIRIWIDGGLVVGSAAGLLDFDPATTYAAATQVLLGATTRLSPDYPLSSTAYLILQAPYSEGSLSSVQISFGVNSGDTLAVTKSGSVPNQGIKILLANATSANNTGALIQTAVRALGFLNSAGSNYVDLTKWKAYWDPTSATPPITASTFTQSMSGSGTIYQSIIGSNLDNFPPTSSSDWLTVVPNEPIVVATPYAEADLFALDVSTQSADVLYIIHSSYPPASLSRYSDTTWVYQPLALYGTTDVVKTGFSALGQIISDISVASPCVITVASETQPFFNGDRIYINECSGLVELNQGQFIITGAGGSAGAYTYNLLALGSSGTGPVGSISGPNGTPVFSFDPSGSYSAIGGSGTGLTIDVTSAPYRPGSPGPSLWMVTALTVDASGAGYNVGDTVSISIGVSTRITSIVGSAVISSVGFLPYTGGGFAVITPALFVGAGNYPACATLYQQRFCLAGALNTPTQMNGSVQGDYPDFICDPNSNDYAIQFTLVSQQLNQVRWMMGTPTALMLGTSGGVWAMFTTDGSSLSQVDVDASIQSTIGTGSVPPQLVNSDVIWITRSARRVRLLLFNFVTNQWEGPDLTRLNRDITIGSSEDLSGIISTAFQAEPYPIFWAVRADGQLLGLTYERQEEVFAWFRVVTDGVIESVACVSEDNAEDQVWISVKRTINGVDQRYIEYFSPQDLFHDLSNAYFVHCGGTFQGLGPFNITSVIRLNPCRVVVSGGVHGLAPGMKVSISNVVGTTQANTNPLQSWTIGSIIGSSVLLDGVDATGWSPYISGGTIEQVTNDVTGLSYLLGKDVVAIGDGQVVFEGPVTGDTLNFGSYANKVTVGLPYTTTIEPMNPVIGSPQATSRGKKQKFSRVTLSMYESIGGKVGTNLNHLHPIDYGTNSVGNPPTMFTGSVTRDLDSDWSDDDTIVIVHSDPFPYTLRSVVPRLSVAEEG